MTAITAVRKGDLVQGLTDGIAKPEATLRDYAIMAARQRMRPPFSEP